MGRRERWERGRGRESRRKENLVQKTVQLLANTALKWDGDRVTTFLASNKEEGATTPQRRGGMLSRE